MKTTFILARHGETEWNLAGRYQGHLNSPLTAKGKMQGRLLSQALLSLAPAIIYSSTLGRARETADIIANMHNLPILEAPGLAEINHGIWQGLTIKEVEEKYPEEVAAWRDTPAEMAMPGGESLIQVETRALEELYRALRENEGKTIVMVSHYAPIKNIICHVLGLPLSHYWRIGQDNACINVIVHDDEGWYLKLLNDTCHLGKEFQPAEPKAK